MFYVLVSLLVNEALRVHGKKIEKFSIEDVRWKWPKPKKYFCFYTADRCLNSKFHHSQVIINNMQSVESFQPLRQRLESRASVNTPWIFADACVPPGISCQDRDRWSVICAQFLVKKTQHLSVPRQLKSPGHAPHPPHTGSGKPGRILDEGSRTRNLTRNLFKFSEIQVGASSQWKRIYHIIKVDSSWLGNIPSSVYNQKNLSLM